MHGDELSTRKRNPCRGFATEPATFKILHLNNLANLDNGLSMNLVSDASEGLLYCE